MRPSPHLREKCGFPAKAGANNHQQPGITLPIEAKRPQ
jgi:hypothetical protein